STGRVNWVAQLGLTNALDDMAAYDNGKVFVVHDNDASSSINAFDAANGNLLWTRPLVGQYSFDAPPTAANGVVYIGGSGLGGTLYAVNESDGSVRWTAPVENGDKSSPAVTSDGVFVAYLGPQVYKFNPTTGSLKWHYNSGTEGGGGRTPVYYNGYLYTRDE